MRDRFLGQIVKGVVVLDRGGSKVGTVERAYRYSPVAMSAGGGAEQLPPDEIVEVKTGFLGLGKRMFVPIGAIEEVSGGNLFLSKSSNEIDNADDWHERLSYLDELE